MNECRDRLEIIADIDSLVQTRGFLVAFSDLLRKETFYFADSTPGNRFEEILYSEIAFVLGRMVINYDYSIVSDSSLGNKELEKIESQLKQLLEELHFTYIIGQIPSSLSDLVRGETATELFFYSDSGAYDIQFIEHVRKVYRYSLQWLKDEFGYDIDVIETIYKILTYRLSLAYHVITSGTPQTSPLDLFRISPAEILLYAAVREKVNLTIEDVEAFLELFSCDTSMQYSSFTSIETRNIVNEKPLIRLPDGNFYFSSPILLAKAIYEFPYHAMIRVKNTNALDKIGDALEKTTYEYLVDVFGEENTFQNVDIFDGKNHITDIDVLVKINKTFIIVQDKNKRLTMSAKAGDYDAIMDDFDKAIQQAYGQGLKAREALLMSRQPKAKIVLKCQGDAIDVDGVNTAYILCINGDYFQGDKMQESILLKVDETSPPVQMSIFDLQLTTHYLQDAYDFMFYLNRRTEEYARLFSESEVNYLAYYLSQDLLLPPQTDLFVIDSDFEWDLRRDYCCTRFIEEEHDYIFPKRRLSSEYIDFVKDIENIDTPVDKFKISALLRSANQEVADKIVKLIKRSTRKALITRKPSDFSMGLKDEKGKPIGGIICVVDTDGRRLINALEKLHCKHAENGGIWASVGYLYEKGGLKLNVAIMNME